MRTTAIDCLRTVYAIQCENSRLERLAWPGSRRGGFWNEGLNAEWDVRAIRPLRHALGMSGMRGYNTQIVRFDFDLEGEPAG